MLRTTRTTFELSASLVSADGLCNEMFTYKMLSCEKERFLISKSEISYGRIFESCLSIVSSYMTSILIYKNSRIFLFRQTVENAVLRWCKQKSHFEDIRINYTCVGEAPWYVSCPLLFTFTLNGTYFQIINREASCIMRNLQILDLLTDWRLYRYFGIRFAPKILSYYWAFV